MHLSMCLTACIISLFVVLVRVDAKHGGKSTKVVSHGSYQYASSSSSSDSSKSGKSINYQSSSYTSYSKGKGGKSNKSGKGSYNVNFTSKSAKGSSKGNNYYGHIATNSKASKSLKAGGNYAGSYEPGYDSVPPTYGSNPPIYYGNSESAYDYDALGDPPMLDGIAVGWWFFPDLNVWYFYGHDDPFSPQQSGPYSFDNGSIICFSGGSFPDGVTSTSIEYKYAIKSDGGSLQDQVAAVESEFARILTESLDCSSARRLLISTRRLGIVGIDPSPADTIGGK